ncbi:MAG: hypothetical protein K2X62_09155 [Beijerinckiaceae bacterium]|jgi:hypothetical protein|nr:hypothetical protein [Beijerinckiaceae bacterium]MDO9443353.1 hypothetical protein [Beijerinckiaceae bacterium]
MASGLKRAALICGLATGLLSAGAAQAAPNDGRWAVTVVTEKGNCEVYRWEFAVANGRVTPIGDAAARASGMIDPRGRVNVNFTRGSDTLSATGNVSGANGSGRWTSPSRQCNGRWSAEKTG